MQDFIATADITLALEEAANALAAAEPGSQAWRWKVRRSLGGVRDVLEAQPSSATGWLSARAAMNTRDGAQLLRRIQQLGPRVLQDNDVGAVVADVRQVLAETQRHFQKINDLAYDEVELELGGSE